MATRRPHLHQVAAAAASLFVAAGSTAVLAQADEIQVYDAGIATPGTFNLTWHNNYAPDGQTTADHPGGVVPNHTLNGVPEWAYGVSPWLEIGLYLPLYSFTGDGSLMINGFKVRTLFVAPNAASRHFFYGLNFEFSYNAPHWDLHHYTSEIRPIVGWHLGRVDLIFNPILDSSYQGLDELDFAPATRLAFNLNSTWSIAVEEYDDFGPLRKFLPSAEQTHQLFGVVNYNGRVWELEGGIGFGLTPASDKIVLKLIASRDLN